MRDDYQLAQRRALRPRPQARVKDTHTASNAEVGGDDSDRSSGWQDLLSATDRRVIHLARALVTNPHVLVLHRPLAALDEDVAEKVLTALRTFIVRRSLFSNSYSTPSTLLRRTVIFSTSTLDERALESADNIIFVGAPAGGATLLAEGGGGAQPSAGSTGGGAGGAAGTAAAEHSKPRRERLRQMCSEVSVGAASGDDSFTNAIDRHMMLVDDDHDDEDEDAQPPALAPAMNGISAPSNSHQAAGHWHTVKTNHAVRSAAMVMARHDKNQRKQRRGSLDIQALL